MFNKIKVKLKVNYLYESIFNTFVDFNELKLEIDSNEQFEERLE
ncbi:hypothetical protein [Clostridium magnum]|nr:hypothetical protein [Clostridium magnum]